ncbi:MAG: anthranilate synthase component II [Desulfovibrionales bacterium]
MILIVDNFDSFTFNLVQVFQQLGAEIEVLRNDEPDVLRMAGDERINGVVISPGPSHPQNTGLCRELLTLLPPELPVLGVCLGHQLLGWMAGTPVVRAGRIMHGKTSMVHHRGTGLFRGVPLPMQTCRYHSLLVQNTTPSSVYDVTAWTDQGEIMGLSYRDKPWVGVQFHPESILTPDGPRVLENFLHMCGETGPARTPQEAQS